MTRAILVTVAAIIVASGAADAHRLDELLQASRVAVTPASVVVHLDLTPGVALASDIISHLDGDGNGRISPREAEAYGRMVMNDLDAQLDGIRIPLDLIRVEVPREEEMHDGVGTIRLELSGVTSRHASGRHVFELRNGHRSNQSAYLANALMPDNDTTILRQERDATQQMFRLHFETHPRAGTSAIWLLAGLTLLLTHARWRLGGRRLV